MLDFKIIPTIGDYPLKMTLDIQQYYKKLNRYEIILNQLTPYTGTLNS